jgi:choline dehydrogenase-like flavoprotein
MFHDARALPDNARLTADVCIVGSGPAGLTLCQELSSTGSRILLVESGGIDYDPERQSLLRGEDTTGEYFPPVDSRRSQFGGTMTIWSAVLTDMSLGVRLVPLDAIDFERRDWVPYSGWPFARTDLDPYYKRAEELWGLAPNAYDGATWEGAHNRCLPLPTDEVITRVYKIQPFNPFLTVARELISAQRSIDCLLRATVTELVPAQGSDRIEYLRVVTSNRKQAEIRARIFVLGAGGIENARLLLLSNSVFPAGIGNSRDLVGRFFMDHPLYYFCQWIPSSPALFRLLGLYDVQTVRGQCLLGRLTLPEAVLRENRLLNLSGVLWPKPKGYRSKGIEVLREMRVLARKRQFGKSLALAPHACAACGDILAYGWRQFSTPKQTSLTPFWSMLSNMERRFGSVEPEFSLEQAPDPSNRVSLSTQLDDNGWPKTLVTWRMGQQTRDSANRVGILLNQSFARAGLGRVVPFRHPRPSPTQHHHIGTTRMHKSPAAGVVDANCRVHETTNLFVAGSSVFCTGGYANPTLTITALAIRLAEHLKKQLAPLTIGRRDCETAIGSGPREKPDMIESE